MPRPRKLRWHLFQVLLIGILPVGVLAGARRSLEAGFAAHLTKPVEVAALAALVAKG